MKNKNFLVNQYSKCYEFLCSSSDFVIIALGIFSAFTIIGFAFPIFFSEQIFSWMEKIVQGMEGFGAFETIGFIFFNNVKASFFSIILGVFLGVFPISASIVNGYLMGFVSRHAVEQEGIFVLWRLLPHGIFELPAIILSIGIGLRLGTEIFTLKGRSEFKKNFIESMRFFIFVIFPLLLIAGIIEGLLIILNC